MDELALDNPIQKQPKAQPEQEGLDSVFPNKPKKHKEPKHKEEKEHREHKEPKQPKGRKRTGQEAIAHKLAQAQSAISNESLPPQPTQPESPREELQIGIAKALKNVNVATKPKAGFTLYHGTLTPFDTFDDKMAGRNTEFENAQWGHFFINDPERARKFVEDTREIGDKRPPIIVKANVDIKKPLDLTIEGILTKKEQAPIIYKALTGEDATPEEALESLNENIDLGTIGELFDDIYSNKDNKKLFEKAGYDGIVSEFGREGGKVIKEYVAFNANQIKKLKE